MSQSSHAFFVPTSIPDFPETVVSVFSHHLFASILNFLGGKVIAQTHDVDAVNRLFYTPVAHDILRRA